SYTAKLREEDDPILITVDAYLTTGSIKQTAQMSFCHRNTVINRIRQLTIHTGLDITDHQQAAHTMVALSSHLWECALAQFRRCKICCFPTFTSTSCNAGHRY